MHIFRFTLTTCLVAFTLALAACGGDSPPGATSAPQVAQPLPTLGTPPVAKAGYCENGGAIVAQPGESAAARVNGQVIPQSQYERQVTQLRDPLLQQGLDPNTDQGKEAMKGLQAQALAQLRGRHVGGTGSDPGKYQRQPE